MQSRETNNLIFIRLFPKESVLSCLKAVCQKHKVETAVVLSGLGQLAKCELGFFKGKGDYAKQVFVEPLELLSLTGNISKQTPLEATGQALPLTGQANYEAHLHAVLGNEQKQTIGGHFISGVVSVTAEIVLLRTTLPIKRILEPETGLMGLFLD